MPSYTPFFSTLPQSVQNFVRFATTHIQSDKVILFGSRARGDRRPNSDFDLAFKKAGVDQSTLTKVLVELENEPLTLFKIDFVDYDRMDQSYRDNIDKEGQAFEFTFKQCWKAIQKKQARRG